MPLPALRPRLSVKSRLCKIGPTCLGHRDEAIARIWQHARICASGAVERNKNIRNHSPRDKMRQRVDGKRMKRVPFRQCTPVL